MIVSVSLYNFLGIFKFYIVARISMEIHESYKEACLS